VHTSKTSQLVSNDRLSESTNHLDGTHLLGKEADMSIAKWLLYLSGVIVTLIVGFLFGTFQGQVLIAPLVKWISPPPAGAEYSKFIRQTPSNKKVIVFVHGVTGTLSNTWLNSAESGKTYWPTLIKEEKDLRDYDVFVASYFTPLVVTGPTINEIAHVIHQDLVRHHILPDDSGKVDPNLYTEVVFICHSMGNLVIRNMMVMYPPQKASTQIPLILSLAAPSAGSKLASYMELVSENPTFNEMVKLDRNSFLQLLNGVWMRAAFDTEIACAYEMLPTPEIKAVIVEKESATAVCTRNDFYGFKETHVSIVKPNNDTHEVHNWAVKQILRKRVEPGWVLPRWIDKEIVIGGKDYPESNLHAAMIAELLKSDPKLRELGLKVKTQYQMGGASRVFSALVNRRIDIYPEYDASLMYEYLRNPLPGESIPTATLVNMPAKSGDTEAMNLALGKSLQTINMKYLPHFGYNDPYVLVMKRAKAKDLGILKSDGKVSMSDLATRSMKDLILIADQEFLFRNEWSFVKERYKLKFKDEQHSKHQSLFKQVKKGGSDNLGIVAVAFGTDPELRDRDIVRIEDDKGVFPAYYPAPLVDKLLLRRYPEIEAALSKLAGIMNLEDVVNLIKDFDERLGKETDKDDSIKHKIMENVAREFLIKKNVLPRQ
jgi:glycine betaine/choline ABC-type transport system substrate-binding protein